MRKIKSGSHINNRFNAGKIYCCCHISQTIGVFLCECLIRNAIISRRVMRKYEKTMCVVSGSVDVIVVSAHHHLLLIFFWCALSSVSIISSFVDTSCSHSFIFFPSRLRISWRSIFTWTAIKTSCADVFAHLFEINFDNFSGRCATLNRICDRHNELAFISIELTWWSRW